jgi:hypothetical protein
MGGNAAQMTAKWKTGFYYTVLIGVAVLFLYTGLSKLFDPYAFAQSIEGYRLVSGAPALVGAFIIPWLECLAAFALFWPRWRKAAILLLVPLLILFQLALMSAYFRGLDIDCGCFGGDASSDVGLALFRNCFLLVAFYFLYACQRYPTDEASPRIFS